MEQDSKNTVERCNFSFLVQQRYMLRAAECPEVKFFAVKKMARVLEKSTTILSDIQNKFSLINGYLAL